MYFWDTKGEEGYVVSVGLEAIAKGGFIKEKRL